MFSLYGKMKILSLWLVLWNSRGCPNTYQRGAAVPSRTLGRLEYLFSHSKDSQTSTGERIDLVGRLICFDHSQDKEPILDLWRRQCLPQGFKPAPQSTAEMFSVRLRIPATQMPPFWLVVAMQVCTCRRDVRVGRVYRDLAPKTQSPRASPF